ncbi:hypothetical protein Tco_0461205 [Tanacetum coccineum]
MYDDMSYAKLHEMLKKKFNMEEDDRINISVRLPSFDSGMEITDSEETYTPDGFTANMNIMQVVQPDAYSKLCQAGTQRWSRSHYPLVRYNYMTSNSVESVNACSVINRKLPVLMLAETYRAMLQEWYFKRKKLTGNVKYEITDWATHKVHKRKLKSATWKVHGVNQFLGLTDCVQYVSDWFKKDKYQATYAESIHFLGDMQEWEYPSHIHPAIPPRMDNPQPGRPKNTNRIRSQGEEPQSIHCSKCKQDGHKRDNCKISIVNEPHVNDQPAFYHQNQSYDHNFQSYNQYPSQPYGDVTYQGQPDYHNQYPTHPSQMNEQYDSQQYGTQHLDDLNNNCSNNLAQLMNHVITNYTSDSEEERKEVTQNDYTYDQMIEWAEQEHFEDEETKEAHYHTQILRQTLLKKLEIELQAEVTLANKLSCELTRVAEQMRIREIHTAMLHAMPLTSLNTYGLHALLMTHESDIRITHNLRTTRDDLLRSIDEKQKCIDNYKAI